MDSKVEVLRRLRESNEVTLVMFGAGELGQEVCREARRDVRIKLVAVDRYGPTPAGRIADKTYTFNMLNGERMKWVLEKEIGSPQTPHVIIPEIEAIDTDMLLELEKEGWNVIPNAQATKVCMNRRLIREKIARRQKF